MFTLDELGPHCSQSPVAEPIAVLLLLRFNFGQIKQSHMKVFFPHNNRKKITVGLSATVSFVEFMKPYRILGYASICSVNGANRPCPPFSWLWVRFLCQCDQIVSHGLFETITKWQYMCAFFSRYCISQQNFPYILVIIYCLVCCTFLPVLLGSIPTTKCHARC